MFFLGESNQSVFPTWVPRVWFATEMGESLIPDRFVDVFQGRAPRSVLAKHDTGKGLLKTKTDL